MSELLRRLQEAARQELLDVSSEQYKSLMERFNGDSESHRLVRGLVERNNALAKLIASIQLDEIPGLMLHLMIMAMEQESDLMGVVTCLKEDGLEEWTPDA